METNFKITNNYTEQIDNKLEVINTCQDCQFSNHTNRCKTNELHCIQGDIIVSVNGICNLFLNIL